LLHDLDSNLDSLEYEQLRAFTAVLYLNQSFPFYPASAFPNYLTTIFNIKLN